MEPYPGDILFGGYLIISVAVFIIGILVFRYRREFGPCLMMASGLSGLFSSILWVLITSETIELPVLFPLVILVLSIVLLILSFFFWRVRH